MSKTYHVSYTVQYLCTVEAEDDDALQDAVSNIDIPEGGANGSAYLAGSFEAHEIHEETS